jgi:CubicO group peptidase (beta-lactamase class C family)
MLSAMTRRAVVAIPALFPVLRAAESAAVRARRMMTQVQSAQKAPGMCAAVWKSGSIVWSEAFGLADLEDGAQASPQTRFRIGSLSKPVTAAAAARLYEEGKLDVDAPIQQYVPGFPTKSGKITARLLLGHLSGLRHYGAGEYLNNRRYSSISDTLKTIEDAPLLQPPGTKYSYSSYGFNLLGAVLEGAATQDFLSLIQRQVCEPLQLRFTTADDNRRILTGRTRYYSLEDGNITNAPYTDLSDRWPSGGLLSTAEDLVRFGAGHLAGPFLKAETLRLMFTSQRTVDGKETGVGFAWRIGSIANHRICHHGGDAIGGRAFLLLRPEDSIVVAFVANLGFVKFAEPEAMTLADFFA